eukprot:5010918-Karenia_brevis.AAC.1
MRRNRNSDFVVFSISKLEFTDVCLEAWIQDGLERIYQLPRLRPRDTLDLYFPKFAKTMNLNK